jgi:hypothetical protein
MNLAGLLRMRPAEIATRAQQEFSKRWAKPPACRLIPSSSKARFPEPPPLDSLAAAEKIRRHRFDLLGYRDLDFGDPIDWHYDPVHQKRAPREPWHKIPFLDFDLLGDHKIIWELNRHQHLVTLAQAGFRDEVIAQWTHWQAENPYPIGINWASALEAGFRALSWLWVRSLMGDFHPDLISALHLHGWHIEHFLSTYFSPNTHLLGEGVALFAIGSACPQIAEAARWQKRGWQIILEQAHKQVRPDGFHFEQSVYYHVYARDFFAFARSLTTTSDLDETIEKMDAALAVLSQSGCLPNFGDDDGGHVIVSRGAGSQPAGGLPGRPSRQATQNDSLSHAGLGGIYVVNRQLFIRAAVPAPFGAGHSHADALSIQLIRDGRPILIDPGTYCYVCPERDRYRGTAAHNTLQIDGRDQATPSGPFAWTNLPEVIVDRWHTGAAFDLLAAHHTGYHPVVHQRWVVGLNSSMWLVRDLVTGPGSHQLEIHWHYLNEEDLAVVPPERTGRVCRAAREDGTAKNASGAGRLLCAVPVEGHDWTQSIDPWGWSPVYGRQEPAKVLRFQKHTQLPAEFAVMLVSGPPGVFRQTAPAAYQYEQPQRSHEFIFTSGHFTYRLTTAEGVTEQSL